MNSAGVRSILRSANKVASTSFSRVATRTSTTNLSTASSINTQSMFSQYTNKSVPMTASATTTTSSAASLKPSTSKSTLSIRSRISRNAISVLELLSMSGSDDDDGV